ncbi:MAG: transglutaminase family protein [Planctomycetota bacterium]
MRYHIRHETEYAYAEAVTMGYNAAHLKPRSAPRQRPLDAAIDLSPAADVLNERTDYFGNTATYFTIQQWHTRMVVTASARVEVEPMPALMLNVSSPWEHVRDKVSTDRSAECLDAYAMSFESPMCPETPGVLAFAEPSFPKGRPILEAASDLTSRIFTEFAYDPSTTTVATPLTQVLDQRSGVCQDFAHLFIAAVRSMGLPCRYVSGYLRTFNGNGEQLVGADATHAWASVYADQFGWIDFDPTNNKVVSDHHVTIAWGRDFVDVSPVKGLILGGGDHTVDVRVTVTPESTD